MAALQTRPQAARRRTYVVRVICAVLLFAVFCFVTYEQFMEPEAGFRGRGRTMFETFIALQFAGILLFLRGAMSGAIAYEKERQSLTLLLLTGLRPRNILLEEYLGRLIPIFTVLLLGLPLLAICYAFGGVTTKRLGDGIYILVLTCVQVGALALMCSAFCSSSLASFIASYVMLAGLYLGLPLLWMLLVESRYGGRDPVPAALVPLWLFFDPRRTSRLLDHRARGGLSREWLCYILLAVSASVPLADRSRDGCG